MLLMLLSLRRLSLSEQVICKYTLDANFDADEFTSLSEQVICKSCCLEYIIFYLKSLSEQVICKSDFESAFAGVRKTVYLNK